MKYFRPDEKYKTVVHVNELGKYLLKLPNKQVMISIVGEDFYIHAPAYVILADLKSLLRFEVTFNEYFPYTLYL